MEYLRLLFGLLIPWAGGFVWLRVVEARAIPLTTGNTFKQIGYGLFLGYAGLYGLIVASDALFPQLLFWPIAVTSGLVTALGALLAYRGPATATLKAPEGTGASLSPGKRAILALLLVWITIHISLVAIEVLCRPVFPWDAWLNWMYRAKTWFALGTLVEFSSPTAWATGMSELAYNVSGHNYPTFVPVIALWVARSLGFWSETLVNLPVLFCGVAMALAIYGQCREMGGDSLRSATAAYLLLSIPMVGTHLALAGMADIWVAGFTGLGFVALLKGLVERSRFQILLGLLLAAVAVAVKIEGFVWFLAAIATFLLATRPRLVLAIACLCLGLGFVAWTSGVTFVELGDWGRLGYADGLFHIPFKGSYPLMQFDLADDYALNFFSRGSWNLLWSLLLLNLPLLFLLKERKAGASVVSFYLVFIATQLLIFGFTEQGRWAEDSTAINRLPLHFTPALIFCLMFTAIIISRRYTSLPDPGAELTLSRALLPALLALSLVTAGLTAYLFATLPESQAPARIFQPQDMKIVVGQGELKQGLGTVSGYTNNIALISSGPVSLAADSLSLLRVETGGDNRNSAGFFWRRGSYARDVDSVRIGGHGVQFLDLSDSPAWQGQITELGLVFYRDGGRAAEFHQLALLPRTIGSSFRTLWDSWSHFEGWTQVSANWIAGGARNPSVPLALFVLVGLLVTLGFYCLFAGSFSRFMPAALACCLVAWMVLDLRWTINRIVQAAATMASFPQGHTVSHLDFGEDEKISALAQTVKKLLPEAPTEVLIFAVKQDMRFQMLRAKYHLIPHPVYVHEGGISSIPGKPVNYLLRINPIFLEPGAQTPDARDTARLLQQQLGQKYEVILDNEIGTLFQASSSDD